MLSMQLFLSAFLRLHLFCVRDHIVDCTDVEEGRLRIIIHLAVDDHLKAAHGLFYRHVLARNTGKVLCHMERLG